MPAKTAATSTPIMAFTSQQVEQLTGLTQRQLRYWEKSGVFTATYVDDTPYRPYRRIYSFRDLVSLRTLALFRNKYGVSLDELRKVGTYLSRFHDAPWASLQVKVTQNRHLIFRDPFTRAWVTSAPLGQAVISTVLLDEVRSAAQSASDKLRERDPNDIGKISRHRHIAHNKWTIAGTRVPTSAIWNFYEAGRSLAEIQQQYPQVTLADVEAAIAHESALREAA